jgi:nicotinamide riboside kinase
MGILSNDEAIVWQEFQKGKNTSTIAEDHTSQQWTPAYVSRVLNRAREKIAKNLQEHANSHRLDIETILDYKGLLIGFDYQTSSQVYIIYTQKLGVIVWYKHDSYAGKLCPQCPKDAECRETLDIIIQEYNIPLRPDEKQLYMTQQAIAIFNKLAAKETPRYKRKGGD